MTIQWSAFDFGAGNSNGMRVGISDVVTWGSVSNGSSTITATVDVYTENTFQYSNDNQVLTFSGGTISGTLAYVNNQAGGISTLRANNKAGTFTYPANSYGSSPTATFTAAVSGTFSGANPTKTITVAVPIRPGTAPGAPGASSTPGNNSVSIGYSAPASAGQPTPITAYQYSEDGTNYYNTPSNPFTLAGTNGVGKTVYVRAVNAYYQSAGTPASSIPRTTPGAPASISNTPNNGSITVTYGAAPDNGDGVGYYQYSTDNGSSYQTVPTNPFNVNGANGTAITVFVRGVNGAGAGASATTTGTPRTTPSAPTSFAGNSATFGQIALSWAAPSSDGGSGVTSYILRNGATVLQNSGATSYTHSGLSPYTDYTYTVAAVNAAGEGTASTITVKSLGGIAKVWNGSAWVTVLPQAWNGSAWVNGQARMWNGTEWKHGI